MVSGFGVLTSGSWPSSSTGALGEACEFEVACGALGVGVGLACVDSTTRGKVWTDTSRDETAVTGPKFVPSETDCAAKYITIFPSVEQLTLKEALVPDGCETETVEHSAVPLRFTKSRVEISETGSEKLTVKLSCLVREIALGDTIEAVGTIVSAAEVPEGVEDTTGPTVTDDV
jgi:hypothetical protein